MNVVNTHITIYKKVKIKGQTDIFGLKLVNLLLLVILCR